MQSSTAIHDDGCRQFMASANYLLAMLVDYTSLAPWVLATVAYACMLAHCLWVRLSFVNYLPSNSPTTTPARRASIFAWLPWGYITPAGYITGEAYITPLAVYHIRRIYRAACGVFSATAPARHSAALAQEPASGEDLALSNPRPARRAGAQGRKMAKKGRFLCPDRG